MWWLAYPIPQICCYFIKDATEVTAVVGRCRVRTDRFDSYPSYLEVSCQMKHILTPFIHVCRYSSSPPMTSHLLCSRFCGFYCWTRDPRQQGSSHHREVLRWPPWQMDASLHLVIWLRNSSLTRLSILQSSGPNRFGTRDQFHRRQSFYAWGVENGFGITRAH